jgi:hypothetical protein
LVVDNYEKLNFTLHDPCAKMKYIHPTNPRMP